MRNSRSHSHVQHYRGYAVQSSAHRLPDGYFSSNLMIERSTLPVSSDRYDFYALDYFSNEAEAIDFSKRWARHWIDSRG
ncbi:hypothetical protein LJR230_001776 [Trinickia sp. LjRoot230]|uniref:hypothetical protein n=1 Tax=Trinickia sp. LjRoot230 TaxID=3342288 RepID=UPI003ECC544B